MKRGNRRNSVLVLLVAACLALSGGVVSSSAATVPAAQTASVVTAAGPDDGWFTSWTQSQQRVAGKVFSNQSMRMITHLSQGGDAVRIRLQNQYGTAPVTINQTSLALSAGGPAIVADSNRALTFNGSESVTIPVGGQVWSDPTSIETTAQQDVAVTFYLAGSPVASLHELAGRNNYGTAANSGNKNSEASGASFAEPLPWTYFVSAVDVYNTDLAGTIVAYGSSVVDGTGSDNCGPGCSAFGQNKRWTDVLARRVAAELPASEQVAVVNEGIGATLSSPACGSGGGLDGVSRLDRDVLALHGVTGVIFYYGTNDIGSNCSATTVLASYRTIFQRLRDANIKVFVTPVTPRPSYTVTMNAHRATVNEFVREGGNCSGTCDGVLDFDTVLKDPANANSINPLYDNGDGAHANVAGQQAIADSISLPMLATAGAPGIKPGELAPAKAGSAYSSTVKASGFPAPSFAVSTGTLPDGLSLDAATGEIAGTPTVGGVSTFTIAASNGVGSDATATYTMTVSESPTITSDDPAPGTVGASYSFTIAATGFPAPTFAVSSRALPAGLSLDQTTGEITGTPTTPGSATFAITASNGVDPAAMTAYSLTVREASSTTTISAKASAITYGRSGVVDVVGPPGASGLVQVKAGDAMVGLGGMMDGAAQVTLGKTALQPGTHTLTVLYGGDGKFEPAETTLTVTVSKATTRTSLTATDRTIRSGQRLSTTVKVTAPGVVPTGRITFRYRGKDVRKNIRLVNGKASVTFRPQVKGRYRLTVTYVPDAAFTASRDNIYIRVS